MFSCKTYFPFLLSSVACQTCLNNLVTTSSSNYRDRIHWPFKFFPSGARFCHLEGKKMFSVRVWKSCVKQPDGNNLINTSMVNNARSKVTHVTQMCLFWADEEWVLQLFCSLAAIADFGRVKFTLCKAV